MTILYFNKTNLKEFLKNYKSYPSGVLQKWVCPFGPYNSILKISWTPRVILFERKQNLKLLKESQYDPYERGVTFDGPEYYTNTIPIKCETTTSLMQKVCEKIRNHATESNQGKIEITSLTCYFKIDADNNLFLLYCSKMTIQQ